MKSVRPPLVNATAKVPTGVTGFDEIPGGGLLRSCPSLRVGGPGPGKTVLALQFGGRA